MSHKCKVSALPETMSVVTGEGKAKDPEELAD